jgi:hypothetical protein
MINETKPPLNMTCRVFRAPTVEAAITEAAAKGYETDFVYWWNGYLYVPVNQHLANTVTEGEDY